MISVLLPTRGRPDGLREAVGSIRRTAAGPVEILAMADLDDQATQQTITDLGLPLYVALERWGYPGLHHYYNRLAEAATGDWMLLWNDDAVMLTPGWDTALDRLPVQVVVANPYSNHGEGLNCFPIVRTWAVRALGHFSLSVHADTWWQDIGDALGIQDRVNIHIRHDRDDLTGRPPDQTRRDTMSMYRHNAYWDPPMVDARNRDIEVLRASLTG